MEHNQGLRPYWARQHIDKYFSKSWNHFDVLGEGSIDVEMVPNFFRMMTNNQTMQFS